MTLVLVRARLDSATARSATVCSSTSRTVVFTRVASGRARSDANRLAGLDDSRPRELPQPRVPPCACEAAPSASAARSGPGASRCTTSPRGSTPTATTSWRVRRTARWCPPASPASASSTTCTTAPDGTPYDDPNAMSHALLQAGRDAGLRITLLDTCYLAAGIGRRAGGRAGALQRRRRGAWAERVGTAVELEARRTCVIGAAIHSVRAVPRDQMNARRRLGRRARRAAARAPVRAGRGERRLPRRLRASRRPRCSPRPAPSARAAAPCTRRTSATRTSSCSAARARTPASARPPSATSATASGRRGCCTKPAHR